MSLLTCDFSIAATNFIKHNQAVALLLEGHADAAVQRTMEDAGAQMDETVPVDTGALSLSRTPVHKLGPLTYGTGYPPPYAPTLEYGGYPGVGPRTVALGGGPIGAGFTGGAGIYSKQAPLGWVRRALASVREPLRVRVLAAVRQSWSGQRASGDASSNRLPLAGKNLGELFGIHIEGG